LCVVMRSFFFFFFFQAEDGIRDLIVTGVQTCALPILITFHPAGRAAEFRRRAAGDHLEFLHGVERDVDGHALPADLLAEKSVVRSEERRVGKECRSRWSPYH